MLLCFEHPELASSYLMSKHLGVSDFSRIMTDITLEGEKALWFISYVLFAMEQLLLSNARWFRIDPVWKSTVEAQLGYHASLLAVVWPEWCEMYHPKMDRVVQRVLSGECIPSTFDIGLTYPPG